MDKVLFDLMVAWLYGAFVTFGAFSALGFVGAITFLLLRKGDRS